MGKPIPLLINMGRRARGSAVASITGILFLACAAGVLGAAALGASAPAGASQRDCFSYAYACTPGYTGANAAGTWAWAHYGGQYAVNANGYHNCTLYAAWRLAENGMKDPGNWGNAVDWIKHTVSNRTPAVGSIAWWGGEVAGGYGHVAYVDAVNGSQVHVVADNYIGPRSRGYTDSGWISASSVDAFLHPHDLAGSQPEAVPQPSPGTGTSGTRSETTGGVTNTWSDYSNAGGTEGPQIPGHDTVQVACKVPGFEVADGDTWWYRIASSPWNNAYYASADAFYNNGATSGSLAGTPFVDDSVANCGSSPAPAPSATPPPPPPAPTFAETVGGVTHTWTNYSNAGGTEGQSIGAYQTVSVSCAVQGFRVADGDTWWYRIASSPWNDAYYASADAFYNNGATSGSLAGTPFVDPSVPAC